MLKILSLVAVFGIVSLCLGYTGPGSHAAQATARAVAPALEPSFTPADVPALALAQLPPRARKAVRAVETDAQHAARLMASRLACGDMHDNATGGRNADCVALR